MFLVAANESKPAQLQSKPKRVGSLPQILLSRAELGVRSAPSGSVRSWRAPGSWSPTKWSCRGFSTAHGIVWTQLCTTNLCLGWIESCWCVRIGARQSLQRWFSSLEWSFLRVASCLRYWDGVGDQARDGRSAWPIPHLQRLLKPGNCSWRRTCQSAFLLSDSRKATWSSKWRELMCKNLQFKTKAILELTRDLCPHTYGQLRIRWDLSWFRTSRISPASSVDRNGSRRWDARNIHWSSRYISPWSSYLCICYMGRGFQQCLRLLELFHGSQQLYLQNSHFSAAPRNL